MKKTLVGILGSALLLGAHALSQTPTSVYVPSNTPNAGTCNVYPFGQRSAIYQCLGTASQLGSPVVLNICDLAFAPCNSTTLRFKTIEIKIGQTKATSLSNTFSSNLVSNVKTVLKATDYVWSVTANTWNRIGLDTSYLYLSTNGNIVVQIVFTGASGGTSMHRDVMPRAYSLNWSGTTPPATGAVNTGALKWEFVVTGADVSTFGDGCAGGNNVTPALSFTGTGQNNTSLSINLAGALPSAGFLLSVNLGRLEPPLDLAAFGAPGCRMYVKNLVTFAGACNSSGAFTLTGKIPSDAPRCTPIYMQFFPFDKAANALGVISSNYGRVLTGN